MCVGDGSGGVITSPVACVDAGNRGVVLLLKFNSVGCKRLDNGGVMDPFDSDDDV